MKYFEMIRKLAICRCVCVVSLCLCISCKAGFYAQVKKNQKVSTKIYNKYLNEYDNVSMLSSMGNFSVIWYYSNGKIHITEIKSAKISSQREYSCDSILNIKSFNQECYPECIDAGEFESSLYDKKADSLYHINVCLDIRDLMTNGTDCPVLRGLREHILKYKLRQF